MKITLCRDFIRMTERRENTRYKRRGIQVTGQVIHDSEDRPIQLTRLLMEPIQTRSEWNVLFQEFPYHLNVNATLYCKYNKQRILTPGDLNCDNIELIGHFRVRLSLHFKVRLSAKSLLWKSVFIHIEIGTNYHNKNFAPRLALKERLSGTQKWPIN